jgi:hypothetical protein
MTRERAEARAAAEAEASRAAPRPARPTRPRPRAPGTPLPPDVKAFLAGLALVGVAAVGWLAFGPSPEPIAPVLGFVDAGPPPAPTPEPSPTPAFDLPWWK